MGMFVWNVLLAVIWAAVNGEFTLGRLIVGFVLAYLVLALLQGIYGPSRYFGKVIQVAGFLLFYVWEIIKANARIAYEVVTPGFQMRPGVIAVPLQATTDLEIMWLANLITMTPGTLSLDVSSDRKVLYIHAMYIEDVEALRRSLKESLERRVLEVLR